MINWSKLLLDNFIVGFFFFYVCKVNEKCESNNNTISNHNTESEFMHINYVCCM